MLSKFQSLFRFIQQPTSDNVSTLNYQPHAACALIFARYAFHSQLDSVTDSGGK